MCLKRDIICTFNSLETQKPCLIRFAKDLILFNGVTRNKDLVEEDLLCLTCASYLEADEHDKNSGNTEREALDMVADLIPASRQLLNQERTAKDHPL